MSEQFRVTVNLGGYRDGEPRFFLRWIDPLSGRRCRKAAGTSDQREAERRAAVLEQELRDGKYAPPSRLPWEDFTWRYVEEVLPGLAPKTRGMVATVFNAVERVLQPARLADLTTPRLSLFAAELRREGKREATIATYLAHLRAALRWAHDLGLLLRMPKLPKVQRARRQRVMKGRPITAEEFERMLLAVPRVRPHDAQVWQAYLTGLWLSGLRLEESLALSWDARAPLAVDLSGRRPVFRIRAEAQKSGRDELLPMTPDFAEWLLRTPGDQRRGRVFKLDGRQTGGPMTAKRVSRVVSAIGEAAGVIVGEQTKRDHKTGKTWTVPKFASAHDLRRSFGTRWAKRVRTATLQRLMRHSAIETTMRYYVEFDAADLADELWAEYDSRSHTRSHTRPEGGLNWSPDEGEEWS